MAVGAWPSLPFEQDSAMDLLQMIDVVHEQHGGQMCVRASRVPYCIHSRVTGGYSSALGKVSSSSVCSPSRERHWISPPKDFKPCGRRAAPCRCRVPSPCCWWVRCAETYLGDCPERWRVGRGLAFPIRAPQPPTFATRLAADQSWYRSSRAQRAIRGAGKKPSVRQAADRATEARVSFTRDDE